MASDSEGYKTFEDRLTKLKQDADNYEKLDDNIKIQQSELYASILSEKQSCEEQLNKYKNVLSTDIKKKKTIACDDNMFNKYMEQVHEIKQKLEQNIPLDELINLYTKFNEAKIQIDVYLNNKKMIIKTI